MDSVWAQRGPDAPALRARSRVHLNHWPPFRSFAANHPLSHPHVLAQRSAQSFGTAGHDVELIPNPRPRTRTARSRLCVRNCRPHRANAAFRILDAQHHPISPWPWAWPCHVETESVIDLYAHQGRAVASGRISLSRNHKAPSLVRRTRTCCPRYLIQPLESAGSRPGAGSPTPSHGAPGPSAELSNNRLDPLLLCNFLLLFSFVSQLPIQPRVSTTI